MKHLLTIVLEFDRIKETKKHFRNLFEPKLLLAMRTLFYQNSRGLQLINAVEAEEGVAFEALVGLSGYLVADDALKLGGTDFYIVVKFAIKFNFSFRKRR